MKLEKITSENNYKNADGLGIKNLKTVVKLEISSESGDVPFFF